MSRILVSALTFSTAFALQSNTTLAGPDETTKRLMNEYVSLLDFGILRLQILLDNNDTIAPIGVDYVWDEDKVVISGVSFEDEWDRESVERACQDWFFSIRHIAQVNFRTGQPFFQETSEFAEMFHHYGYDNTVAGKDTSKVAAEMDKKFTLIYSWYSGNKEVGEVKSVTCTGPLLDTGYSVKVETVE